MRCSLLALLLLATPASAWFDWPATDFDACYIASVNSVDLAPVASPPALAVSASAATSTYSRGACTDGTYIYAATNGGLRRYSAAAGVLTFIDEDYQSGVYLDACSFGSYIYVACGLGGVSRYGGTGGTLTFLNSDIPGTLCESVCSNAEFVFAACTSTGLRSYFQDLTVIDTKALPNCQAVWADSSYLYAADLTNGLYVYSIGGSGYLTAISQTVDDAQYYWDVWGDGNFIYAACSDGLYSYSVDGSGYLTLLDSLYIPTCESVWGANGYIYVTAGNGLSICSVDASGNLTLIDTDRTDEYTDYHGGVAVGGYAYTATSAGMLSYTLDSGGAVSAPEAGTVSGPLTITVHTEDSSLASQVLTTLKLQYKPTGGSWTDLAPAYTDVASGGLTFTIDQAAFGSATLTHTQVAKSASGLIRLYFAGGLYENADLADDPDADGTAGTWLDQWVTSFSMSTNTRPAKPTNLK